MLMLTFMAGRKGLSPRVRGNRGVARAGLYDAGSIPACAGEPSLAGCTETGVWVYPRVCGGTFNPTVGADKSHGLSPRVRGNHLPSRPRLTELRSIPACAGEPADENRF